MFDAADSEGPAHTAERRTERRRRSLLHGTLLSPSYSLTSDCTVRDVSTSGAKIVLSGIQAHPGDTILVITKTGMAYEAATIWTHGSERGLRFERSFELGGELPSRLRHAHRLWIDNLPR